MAFTPSTRYLTPVVKLQVVLSAALGHHMEATPKQTYPLTPQNRQDGCGVLGLTLPSFDRARLDHRQPCHRIARTPARRR